VPRCSPATPKKTTQKVVKPPKLPCRPCQASYGAICRNLNHPRRNANGRVALFYPFGACKPPFCACSPVLRKKGLVKQL
jgi:hypothetical protein